jgi:hypothetical protein
MLRRPERVAQEFVDVPVFEGIYKRILPADEQKLAIEDIRSRAKRAIHEDQDTLDIRLHREETLGGEEKLKEIFLRENPQFEIDDTEKSIKEIYAQVRNQYYGFDRWRTRRLFNSINELYNANYQLPAKFYGLSESGYTQEAVELLANVFHVVPPKVSIVPRKEIVGAYADYDTDKKEIRFPHQTPGNMESPYYIAHEFFHHLLNVSPDVFTAERQAERFLERIR